MLLWTTSKQLAKFVLFFFNNSYISFERPYWKIFMMFTEWNRILMRKNYIYPTKLSKILVKIKFWSKYIVYSMSGKKWNRFYLYNNTLTCLKPFFAALSFSLAILACRASFSGGYVLFFSNSFQLLSFKKFQSVHPD